MQFPEYLDGRDPPGGFFWMGPAGTITPFHHDLTNNFMAQVIGRKRLKIAPSWDMPLMRNHLHVFSQVDGRVTPPRPSPTFDEPQILECILNPGEILFLPIGCLHYVEGLDISVTVSFTNFVFDNDFSSLLHCNCPSDRPPTRGTPPGQVERGPAIGSGAARGHPPGVLMLEAGPIS